MTSVEPIYSLEDDPWIYFDRQTGEVAVDIHENAMLHNHLHSSHQLCPRRTGFRPEMVNKMMAEVWAAVLHSNINPRLLHNEMLKVKEYQDVCPADALGGLSETYTAAADT